MRGRQASVHMDSMADAMGRVMGRGVRALQVVDYEDPLTRPPKRPHDCCLLAMASRVRMSASMVCPPGFWLPKHLEWPSPGGVSTCPHVPYVPCAELALGEL